MNSDSVFAGSVPQLYDSHLVPILFEFYAKDLASRAAHASTVLEIACGTGAVTRELVAALPDAARIVATDLNQPMLDHAQSVASPTNVEWRQADVMSLPFDDDTFDVAVCQFGIMFFPDKVAALAEMKRVVKPGGTVIFNVWDSLGNNHMTEVVEDAVAELFPEDPPGFMGRVPFSYYERDSVLGDVSDAGLVNPEWIHLEVPSVAESATVAAIAFCQGTPLRNEIEARDPERLAEVTQAAATALAAEYASSTEIVDTISAFVVVASA